MVSRALVATLMCLALAREAVAQATPGRPATGSDAVGQTIIHGGVALIETYGPTLSARDPRATPTPNPFAVRPDGSSVGTIIAALYESVSHGPEYDPNWKRMRSLFLPAGMLIPPKRPTDDTFTVLDLNGFQDFFMKGTEAAKQRGESGAFFESEVARTLDCYGNVCQAFSTYASRRAPFDTQPFARGINSIQLVNDGRRWWIASVVWDTERPNGSNPIPAQYEK